MKEDKLSRRHFLQGSSGLLVALPMLPSLLPRLARGQSVTLPKFMVIVGSEHGGTGARDWYPEGLGGVYSESILNQLSKRQLFSGTDAEGMNHEILHGRLRDFLSSQSGHPGGDVDSGQQRVSYILGAHLNPYIDSMNFYRGIDIGPEYAGHGVGVISGNMAAVANSATYRNLPKSPSLDYFLGQHEKFYGANSTHSVPRLFFGGRSLSYDLEGAPIGGLSANQMFTNLFSKYDKNPTKIALNNDRKLLVDHILQDYKNLTQGAYGLGRKISSEDKQKVENHVGLLADLQRKYVNTQSSCGDVVRQPAATTLEDQIQILVAAYTCGATRLGAIWAPIGSNHPNYHDSVAHSVNASEEIRMIHTNAFRWQSINVIQKLLDGLRNAPLAEGKSVFDQSLVYWMHESGVETHSGSSVNLVSFGNAGGALNTGYFVDYRNRSNRGHFKNQTGGHPGLLVNQWYATALHAMGLTKADYAHVSVGEQYGSVHHSNQWPRANAAYHGHMNHIPYPDRLYTAASNPLPIVVGE